MDIDARVDSLYKLAKKNPENPELQEAVSVVKSLRYSQGSLKQWNQRYRDDISDLSENIENLQGKIDFLNAELDTLNAEMLNLTGEIAKKTAEKEKAIAELRSIEREIKRAAHNVRETKSIYGKFSILWTLLRSLFLDDDWADFGAIDNRLPTDPDKPQMGSGQADNNRSLLDK